MVSGVSRARRLGAVSTVLVLLLGTALVWFALRADGDVVRKTDLFDGGVWVTNAEQARFGRLNKPAGQLDAGIASPGTQSSGLDVVQDGAAVLGVSKASNQLLPINPRTATLSDSSQITLPAPQTATKGSTVQAVVDLRGGSVAIADPAKGSVWAQRIDTRAGVGTLEQLQPSQKPRAVLGGDTVVAVGADGTVYAASGTKGDLATFKVAPGGDDFVDPVMTKLGFTTAALQLTAVGGHWVALDGATGNVWSDASPQPVALGSISGAPVLQQAGPDAASVLVQTGTALLAVPLAGGPPTAPVAVPTAGVTGLVASQPVVLGACLHAAWAGPDSVWYGRSCTTDQRDDRRAVQGETAQQSQPAVELGKLTKGVRTDGVKLRVNRGPDRPQRPRLRQRLGRQRQAGQGRQLGLRHPPAAAGGREPEEGPEPAGRPDRHHAAEGPAGRAQRPPGPHLLTARARQRLRQRRARSSASPRATSASRTPPTSAPRCPWTARPSR